MAVELPAVWSACGQEHQRGWELPERPSYPFGGFRGGFRIYPTGWSLSSDLAGLPGGGVVKREENLSGLSRSRQLRWRAIRHIRAESCP
jgi:hypothetical protein